MSKITVSVVVPAYNEEKNIRAAVTSIKDGMQQLGVDYEIVLVDDGSCDQTGLIVREMASASLNTIKTVHLSKNMGKGAALAAGFRQACKEWVLMMDADLQININELPPFLSQAGSVDMVIGRRFEREDSFFRRVASKWYGYIIFLLFGIRCSDLNCPFKLIKRAHIKDVTLQSSGFFVDVELIYHILSLAGKIAELDVVSRTRKYGTSTVRFRHIIETIKELGRFLRTNGRV